MSTISIFVDKTSLTFINEINAERKTFVSENEINIVYNHKLI